MAMRLAVTIGPALWIERGAQGNQLAAEFFDHVLNHVIPSYAQCVAHQLGGQVPIAEMPGDLHKMRRVLGKDLDQVFRLRQDFDDPAVFQNEAVPMMKMNRISLIQKKGKAICSRHCRTAAMTVFAIQRDRVCGLAGPFTGGFDAGNPDHEVLPGR
jgi:hypothetical protein